VVRKRKRGESAGDDQGFSLVELIVTMGIMSVVMAVASTALLQIYSGAKQIEQTSVAADQLDTSLARLERELRYATHVSGVALGTAGNKWYLEFGIPAEDTSSPKRCRQLQFDLVHKSLRLVSWDLPGTNAGVAPVTLATNLVLDSGVRPFTVYEPGTGTTGKTLPPGTVLAPDNKYSMIQLQFKVRVGKIVQPVDNTFASQNITSDTVADETTDTRCSVQAGRP
jgi:prepilin-type N-terminal cleavage/methylation domain-containing protein